MLCIPRKVDDSGRHLDSYELMNLLHPKFIHYLTTAYYNSLYLTSVFIQLYITGLFVVSYCMPYGGSHCKSRPLYILTSSPNWFFQTGPFSCDVNSETCAMAAFVSHMDGWLLSLVAQAYISYTICCEPTLGGSFCPHEIGAQCMRLYLSSDTTDRMLRGWLLKVVRDMQPFGSMMGQTWKMFTSINSCLNKKKKGFLLYLSSSNSLHFLQYEAYSVSSELVIWRIKRSLIILVKTGLNLV